MNETLSAWLADNPAAAETGDDEARILGVLDAAIAQGEATLLEVGPPRVAASFAGAHCNAFLPSRGVVLWAFAAEEDRAAFLAATRRKLRKSTVVARLIEAGKIAAAMQALMSDPASFARWTAPDHPEVFHDDPTMLALLTAIGADVASVTAPEAVA